jgi:hypothetical protein
MASHYQQLIGVLHWMCEIGQIDLLHDVSIMSQHLALPCKGHWETVYGIFGYLVKRENSRIVFDGCAPVFADSTFKKHDWSDIYGDDLKENIPADMPQPCGNAVTITIIVDANHAGNLVTQQSHSGILIFVQNASILPFTAVTKMWWRLPLLEASLWLYI